MKSLKIGIVLNQYPVISETFIDTFLSHLGAYDVIIYASYTNEPKTVKFNIIPYLNRFPSYRTFIKYFIIVLKIPIFCVRLFRLFKKGVGFTRLFVDAGIWTTRNLDVLHFPFATTAIDRELYASLLGAKMTISFRGSDLNVYPIFHQFSYNSILIHVARVHCNSIELKERLLQYDNSENLPVQIIYPSLRKNIEKKTNDSLLVTAIGNIENPLIISTIGRLHWIKDYPFALRVMSHLKNQGIIFKYFILGEGREREHLMFLINYLGLQEYVFICGNVNVGEINSQLGVTHLYLQTSLSEGFSNACIEAQSFGIPCIVPSISGMSHCVEDWKTGIIVKNRDENSFVDAIIFFIDNYCHFDSQYISSRIREKFSIEIQREQWNHFFNSLF